MAGVRLNILCLVGAVVGVIAVFSTWITVRVTFLFISNRTELNLIDVYNQVSSSSDFWLPAVLLLIGAVVAFISPLGGILQVIGVPLFILAFTSTADGRLPSGIGPYLALAGAIIVLASLVYPIGLGYRHKPIGTLGRILTVSPGARALQPPGEETSETPPNAS